MQIHELNPFSGTLDASAFLAVDNGNDTGKVAVTSITGPLNDRIDDIITSPAPTEQEIIDARRGWNEVYYASLGTAIRSQVKQILAQFYKFNTYDLLAVYGTPISRTRNGVTFTWDDAGQVCSVSGEAVGGDAYASIYTQTGAWQGVFERGVTYTIGYETTDPNVKLRIAVWEGVETTPDYYYFDENGHFGIPPEAAKIGVDLWVESGDSVSAVVKNVYMLRTYTAEEVTATIRDAMIGADLHMYNSLGDAIREQLRGKVDKVTGKVLSTNDFTDAEKTKLSGIEAGSEVNAIEAIKLDGAELTPDANRAVDIPVDETLMVEGVPADAKKTGEEISAAKSDISLAVETVTTWGPVPLEYEKGYYDKVSGVFHSDTTRRTSRIDVTEGEKYKLSTVTRPTTISGIVFFNSSDAVIGTDLDGTGTEVVTTDYEFTIPANAVKVAVQSSAYTNPPTLKKQTETKEFVGYTKDEINAFSIPKRYGIKWEISNPDDLGTRCFDAISLSAAIGIGATNGSSDFDSIYPWSEIKRCNIAKNSNGAETVTFEGESGFALDGTNGDVFVRIPKFYYERYREGGYEYRVVSAQGTNVHPAFVEDGKELDEIFISAFEGFVDSSDKLRSLGGVIPTSNITPQEFLTSAQSNGINYSLYDNRCVDVVWTLMAIEFGCRNTNQIIGYGLADFEQPVNNYPKNQIVSSATNTNTIRTNKWTSAQKGLLPVGGNITVCDTDQTNILTQAKITACEDSGDYTDWTFDGNPIDVDTDCFIGAAAFCTNWCEDVPSGALNWHTGRAAWKNDGGDTAKTRNPVRYRWIENVVGNLWHFLPDVTFNALQMYVCENMRDYVMHKYVPPYYPENSLFPQNNSNGNKSDVVGYNYWITDLDSGQFTKGIDFGRSYSLNLTSSKAFGAYYYLYNTNVVISNGGGFDHLYRSNVLTQRAWQKTDTNWYLYGARLMYKHIN